MLMRFNTKPDYFETKCRNTGGVDVSPQSYRLIMCSYSHLTYRETVKRMKHPFYKGGCNLK